MKLFTTSDIMRHQNVKINFHFKLPSALLKKDIRKSLEDAYESLYDSRWLCKYCCRHYFFHYNIAHRIVTVVDNTDFFAKFRNHCGEQIRIHNRCFTNFD